jgi:DNA-binding transcriptional ArsR family regulator
MLMEAVRWLEESGLAVDQQETLLRDDARADAVLDIAAGEAGGRFVVELRQRAPYPNELVHLERSRKSMSQLGNPLLVVPFVSESLGGELTRAGWSWADEAGNFDLRAPGLVFRQRRALRKPRSPQKTLPRGSGSFGVIRALIRSSDGEDEGASATALAAQARVSQPRASQVLRRLESQKLVERVEHGRWRPHREALLDQFLAEYPGPGGSETYFYALDSLTEVAIHAVRLLGRQVVVSADVGPDLILAWRRPSKIILYVRRLISSSDLRIVEAQGRHDANVVVRMPSDQSVFPASPPLMVEIQGVKVGLADPSQMLWDLHDLGGTDRMEAAGELRKWLLKYH